uniref:Uncharacterized protein n=1 Tax=Caudovirales sp. ctEpl1 TaxID=2826770 RepID=A0A8S5NQS3_9CAUD|nr:MAG TPA: hypothetical protein [Caudovirales sp. ctEpl1]
MTKITLDFTKFNHQLILDILDYVESDIFEFDIIQLPAKHESIFTSLISKVRNCTESLTINRNELGSLISSINYVLKEIELKNIDQDIQDDYFPDVQSIFQLKQQLDALLSRFPSA